MPTPTTTTHRGPARRSPDAIGRRRPRRTSGAAINSLNLACSGARTYTQTGGDFKPGLDWYNDGTRRSQVVELDAFARTHNVKVVTVLIGANNFGFADIVQQCVTNWLTSPSWWKNYCYDDSSISNRFTNAAVEARTNEVAGALANVAGAMAQCRLPARRLEAGRADLLVADPQRCQSPLRRVGLDAAERRRLRRVEP